jgi:alpha-D-ribose 1-methylphosphonate 5-triphosphate synthase subunit PhnG
MNAPASRDSLYAYQRKSWISLLNRAPRPALMETWRALGAEPVFDWIRKPEFGLVMLRGRIGGSGARFNLGEATVTRCALKLKAGNDNADTAPVMGVSMILGRDIERARACALLDAMLQDSRRFEDILNCMLKPLEQALTAERKLRAGAAAATKVEFFTMVRGE